MWYHFPDCFFDNIMEDGSLDYRPALAAQQQNILGIEKDK
jgi:hypothetical protein